MTTRIRLDLQGTVQGIGFRPFVYRVARRHGLTGFVLNDSRGAEIEVQGDEAEVAAFVEEFRSQLPPLASISEMKIEEIPQIRGIHQFEIRKSQEGGETLAFVTPDAHVCEDCLREMRDPKDRRFHYPFINCTNCGPRFTIIKAVPYDRPLTTMAKFSLCGACHREYIDPMDRRFHAQPVACPACGPQVWIEDAQAAVEETADPIESAGNLLASGKILAIKGLGGFHLAVDARNEEAVRRLRKKKWREDKPLALMVRDIRVAAGLVEMNPKIEETMSSPRRPIVLVEKKSKADVAPSVAPGVGDLGIMLPYTPLHHLLLAVSPPALVMTSGNPSAEPLAHENDKAVERLRGIADAFLLHDRDIYNPCDDSVVRWSAGGPAMVRRARGYAPEPLTPKRFPVEESVLALGPELKNTITVTRKGQMVVSQHLGDLTNTPAVEAFSKAVERILDLLGVEPCAIACDEHPHYFSTRFAQDRFLGLPLERVQHHHAHMAAVMVEHDRPLEEKGIAALWDGTGFGRDETTWGGEFFLGGYKDFERLAHTRAVPLPGGDAATKHPWRVAVAALHELGEDLRHLSLSAFQRQPREDRDLLLTLLDRRLRCPMSGGAGRLFDAAAAILDFHPEASDEVTYEAQAAVELEALCGRAPITPKEKLLPYDWCDGVLDLLPALAALAALSRQRKDVNNLAVRFTDTAAWACAEVLLEIGACQGVSTAVLSGGCFANRRLLDLVRSRLSQNGMEVLVPGFYPPNDGGVSLGQAAVTLARRTHLHSSE